MMPLDSKNIQVTLLSIWATDCLLFLEHLTSVQYKFFHQMTNNIVVFLYAITDTWAVSIINTTLSHMYHILYQISRFV